MLITVLLSCLLLAVQYYYYEDAGPLKLIQVTLEILTMQKSVHDQENCTDIKIWSENGTYNNRAGHKEMSLIDNWMTTDPDFASNMQRDPNLPSTSKADNAAWHEVWIPVPVKEPSDQQKKEKRQEKNRKSAEESRKRKKQIQLKAKKDNEILEKTKTQLTDDIERLKINLRDLEIVKDSIIHQESCKDKSDIVDINEDNSGCTRSMQVQTLEKMKDNSRTEIILSEKNATSDHMCVTGYGYQQQEQQSIEQEAGTQPGLSSTQDSSFAPSCSSAFSSSCTNLQPMSETSQVNMLTNQDCNLMYSLNHNTTNDQLPLIPGQSVSDLLSLISVRNGSDQMCLIPGHNVSDLSSPISVRNGSDQLCFIPGQNVSDQSSLFPGQNVSNLSSVFPEQNVSDLSSLLSGQNVSDLSSLFPGQNVSNLSSVFPEQNISDLSSLLSGQNVSDLSSLFPGQNVSDMSSLFPGQNVSDMSAISVRNGLDQVGLIHGRNISDQSALIPVGNVSDQSPQVTVNADTTVIRSQSNISYLSQQPHSAHHSTFAHPWSVEADQNDDNERQALLKFFLE